MSSLFRLHGHIAGESRIFFVEIQASGTVSMLKEVVKAKNSHRLDHLDAYHLTIYKLGDDAGFDASAVRENAFSTKDYGAQAIELQETELISEYWSNPQLRNFVHFMVELPQDLGSKRRREEEDGADAIAHLRKKVQKGPPSELAVASLFKKLVGPGQDITLNRPYECDTIPLTLYHPAFGNFKDRCKRAPSSKALKCLLALSESACEWYKSELERQSAVAQVFKEHLNLDFHAESVPGTAYKTDGNLAVNIMPAVLRECENESGDAINQAILYCAHFLVLASKRYRQFNTCFPCILLIDMGSQIGFYGSIWDGQRLRVEPLTRILDLTMHCREKRERDEMASTLDALVEATADIQDHYSSIQPRDSWNHRRQFPFLSSYVANGQTINFTYGRRFEEKLVFSVTVDDPHYEARECVVKFTNKYSYDAHVHLSKLNLAPRIRANIPISTDWTAVVMDNLTFPTLFDLRGEKDMLKEKQDEVRNKVRDIVRKLHEGGFVHGDVRDTNVLVDPASLQSADVTVFLIDFDWAGAAGTARYPNDVNTETVKRPEGVKGGGFILPEHDLEMVENL